MRTTIRLNDDLLAQAKEAAVKSGRTLTRRHRRFAATGIGVPERAAQDGGRFACHRRARGGLRPGVNLDSTAELLDIMDGIDATP